MRSHSVSRSLLCVLCLLASDSARAQSLDWVRQDGGAISTTLSIETPAAIAVDTLGNSYITGTFRNAAIFGGGEANETILTGLGTQDIFVAKYDPNGLLVWARSAGGGSFHQDWVWGIAVDAGGSSYVTGAFAGISGPVDFGNGVVLPNGPGAFIVKYDTDGNAAWARTLHSAGVGYAIAVDAQGNSYVGGAVPGPLPQGLPLITVWKVGADGAVSWTRSAEGVYGGAAYGISVDSSGNSALTGEFGGGTAIFGPGEPNQTSLSSESLVMFAARYDTAGNLLWARQSSAATQAGATPRGNAIATDATGNSYLVGVGSTILGLAEPNETPVTNAWAAKYDSAGNLAWARSVAPVLDPVAWLASIASTLAGEAYVVGHSFLGNAFIVKYDSNGGLIWSRLFATLAAPADIARDSSGHAYLAGQFAGTATFAPGEPNETVLSTTDFRDTDVFVARYLLDETAQNVPPVAVGQDVTTPEDTPLAIVLIATDADGDPLSYEIVSPPAYGVLNIVAFPVVIYTPHPNYHGSDEFTFRAHDGRQFSNIARVTITVTPVNDAPVAHDRAVATAENTPVSITVSGQDVDGDPLSFDLRTSPAHGLLTGAFPTVTYTPSPGYVGPDSFTFTARDGVATSAPATVSITVGLTSIGCGTLTSGSISARGEVDRYSFFGQAGRIISLALASTGGFSGSPGASTSAELTLLSPSGAAVGLIRSNSQANFTLPETGTYVVRVNARNLATIGSYNLNLECIVPPSDDAVPLTCGALASGQIGARGQVDLFTFSGSAGHIISLALASTGGFSGSPGASTSAELTLFSPSGTAVGLIRSNSQANFTLPETGTYVARVSARNLATTGSYNVNLECLFPPVGVPLTCGALAPGLIAAPGQVDVYTVSGFAGQVISLALASTGGFSGSPGASTSAELTVFSPSGTAVGLIRSNSQANFRLSETGTHVIRVSARNLATTGSYNLNVECLFPPGADATPLTCGTPANGQIDVPAEVDLFTMSGQAGQIISLAFASTGGFSGSPGASTSAELTLFAPSATAVGLLRSNSQASFTLPETGTYVTRVSARNLARTGSYRLTLGCAF